VSVLAAAGPEPTPPTRRGPRRLPPLIVSTRTEVIALAAVLLIAALLRLPALDRLPPGLFLDEASRGYDAYALLRTGADQYGVRWPLFAEGLDDYTPTLYTMLVIPSVALLGLTEVAVRLPAALVGIATVGTTHLLGRSLFGAASGLIAALLLAISPWHILPSRTGTEWVLLPLFMTLGVWLLLRGRSHGPSLVLAGLVLGVGLYSYAFARLLVPLLVVGFVALWWREIAARWRWALAGLVVLLVLAMPIVLFGLTPAGQARLQTVVPLDRYRGLALVPYYLKNLASYFGPGFLLYGDEPTFHHRLDGFGPVLLVMVPLLLNVLYELVRRPTRLTRSGLLCLWWIVAAPASAALHRESPSSALLLGAIPAWQLLAGLGGALRMPSGDGWRHRLHIVLTAGLVALWLMTTAFVTWNLYVQYPVYAAEDWLFGSREIVQYLGAHRGPDEDILVSDRLSTPHILVLFFAGIDPASYQRAPIHVRQPNVRSKGEIGPYRFGRIQDLIGRPGRHLVWVSADEGPELFGPTPPVYGVRGTDGRPSQLVYEIGRP
jgi:4-amino-4-deoxy-L-arabinose transferase-like glycosyltransferase